MKTVSNVKEFLEQRFVRAHRKWIADEFPSEAAVFRRIEINLDVPTDAEASQDVDAVRRWVAGWNDCHLPGEVTWDERRWRHLGTQRVPVRLTLNTRMDIAMWAGKERQWIAILERAQEMIVKWPALQAGIDAHYSILADFPEEDYRRVFLMADWLFANPNSGLYPRQLPVAGVDSKWLEGRKGTIARLVTAIRGDINDIDFYRVCGLKPLPKSMRIRLLDPALRQRCGGLGDITAPIEEIAQLDIGIDMVLILENLQTGLALGDLPGTAAIMGLGMAWMCCRACHGLWQREKPCIGVIWTPTALQF